MYKHVFIYTKIIYVYMSIQEQLINKNVRNGFVLAQVSDFRLIYQHLHMVVGRWCRIGCHIASDCVSHITYADDMVLLASSIKALQTLSNICLQVRIIYYIMELKPSAWLSGHNRIRNVYCPRYR